MNAVLLQPAHVASASGDDTWPCCRDAAFVLDARSAPADGLAGGEPESIASIPAKERRTYDKSNCCAYGAAAERSSAAINTLSPYVRLHALAVRIAETASRTTGETNPLPPSVA